MVTLKPSESILPELVTITAYGTSQGDARVTLHVESEKLGLLNKKFLRHQRVLDMPGLYRFTFILETPRIRLWDWKKND